MRDVLSLPLQTHAPRLSPVSLYSRLLALARLPSPPTVVPSVLPPILTAPWSSSVLWLGSDPKLSPCPARSNPCPHLFFPQSRRRCSRGTRLTWTLRPPAPRAHVARSPGMSPSSMASRSTARASWWTRTGCSRPRTAGTTSKGGRYGRQSRGGEGGLEALGALPLAGGVSPGGLSVGEASHLDCGRRGRCGLSPCSVPITPALLVIHGLI
jgi:hypothetical protein